MGLKAPVYASRITGLGDARYFSGMGVSWLGIQADPSQPGYLSPERFREIAGWISGPAFVLETDLISHAVDFNDLTAGYGPSLFCIGIHQVEQARGQAVEFGIRIRYKQLASAIACNPKWIILSDFDNVLLSSDLPDNEITLLHMGEWTSDKAQDLLNKFPRSGFAINGSPEEKPGLKIYEAGPFLEWLDEY